VWQSSDTTVTDKNLIHEEIKSRLNLGNGLYHSARNILSPCLLSKNVKIKIWKTMGIRLLSLTLREEHRLKENI
jgi:hypothetical protein